MQLKRLLETDNLTASQNAQADRLPPPFKSGSAELVPELEGFVWRGKNYAFNQIKHLTYLRVSTSQSVNMVKTGVTESATLKIVFTTNDEFTVGIDEAGVLWNSNKKIEIQNLGEVYSYIARRSFKHRLLHYDEELQTKGYFTIDECSFYPRQKVVFRRQEFPVESTSFMRGGGYVEMRKKEGAGFWGKVKREFTLTKLPQFNTQTDTDIVFYLLEKHFGIRWEN